jgi:hypothetical protein
MEHLAWRPMDGSDLDGVMAIAEVVHPDYPERPAVFAERLALFPQGCHVLADGVGVFGYIVSHPWRAGAPVPLDSFLESLPAVAGTRYLHDIALLPEARGAGHAGRGVARVVRDAYRDAAPSLSIVAIPGTQRFWEGQGFADRSDLLAPGTLGAYGGGALWMVRDLAL